MSKTGDNITLFKRLKRAGVNSVNGMATILIIHEKEGVGFETIQNIMGASKDATQNYLARLISLGLAYSLRPKKGKARASQYYLTEEGENVLRIKSKESNPHRYALVVFRGMVAVNITSPAEILALLTVRHEQGLTVERIRQKMQVQCVYLARILKSYRDRGFVCTQPDKAPEGKSSVYFPTNLLKSITDPS